MILQNHKKEVLPMKLFTYVYEGKQQIGVLSADEKTMMPSARRRAIANTACSTRWTANHNQVFTGCPAFFEAGHFGGIRQNPHTPHVF